ncbi:uncharacterized, partial [Tachysurus ichikawai]
FLMSVKNVNSNHQLGKSSLKAISVASIKKKREELPGKPS